MNTTTSVLTTHGYSVDAQEYPELEIPILSASQRQGDVLLLKIDDHDMTGARPIGARVEVVRSEQGSNTHTLHGDGDWLPNPAATDPDELVQGWLRVPAGGEAWLIHTEEHSAIGVGPGVYEVRRQREFAGEWRRVAD